MKKLKKICKNKFTIIFCLLLLSTRAILTLSLFEEVAKRFKNDSDSYYITLELAPEELQKHDSDKNNLLHIAIINDKHKCLKSITDLPIPLEVILQKNFSGKTPLQLAVDRKNIKCAQLIIESVNNYQETIFWHDQSNKEIHLKTALLNCGNDKELFKLLDYMLNAICNARYENPKESHIDAQNEDGDSIFHLIIKNRILSIKSKLELFMHYEEVADLMSHHKNNEGKTIIDLAVALDSDSIKKYFHRIGFGLEYSFTELKNKLLQLKSQLTKLQAALTALKASLS